MVEAEAMDRLPWLASEARPQRRTRQLEIGGLAVIASLLLGGAISWLLLSDLQRPSRSPTASTTIVLPRAKAPVRSLGTNHRVLHRHAIALPRPEAAVARAQTSGAISVQQAEEKQGKSSPVHVAINANELLESAPEVRSSPAAEPTAGAIVRARQALQSQPDHGLLVHVAAFADIGRAKPVWSKLERAYPAVSRLRAAVIENRDWNGQPFYQFQVATASEEQSQALCQSARISGFRCEVIRTP